MNRKDLVIIREIIDEKINEHLDKGKNKKFKKEIGLDCDTDYLFVYFFRTLLINSVIIFILLSFLIYVIKNELSIWLVMPLSFIIFKMVFPLIKGIIKERPKIEVWWKEI